jgi:hypothetical protein
MSHTPMHIIRYYYIVPPSMESYGRLGKPAMWQLNTMGIPAAESGKVSMAAFVLYWLVCRWHEALRCCLGQRAKGSRVGRNM